MISFAEFIRLEIILYISNWAGLNLQLINSCLSVLFKMIRLDNLLLNIAAK